MYRRLLLFIATRVKRILIEGREQSGVATSGFTLVGAFNFSQTSPAWGGSVVEYSVHYCAILRFAAYLAPLCGFRNHLSVPPSTAGLLLVFLDLSNSLNYIIEMCNLKNQYFVYCSSSDDFLLSLFWSSMFSSLSTTSSKEKIRG